MARGAMVATVVVLLALPAVAGAAAAGPRFSAPVYNRSEHLTDAIVAADLNGDGNPDLATSDQSANSVSVLFGTGHGDFRRAVTYRGAGGLLNPVASVLTAGDLN